MMHKPSFYIPKLVCYALMLFVITSCSSALKPEDLYGEWKYTEILNVRTPSESTTADEIAAETPSIRFTDKNYLVIMWGGKQLSHGKFRVDGKMIRYTEDLPGGKTREFPFLVSVLTADKLVFETMTSEATRVTARKVK